MSAPRGRLAGACAALVAVSIWGGWIPITRFALVTRLRPEDVAALRFAVAGLLLSPVLALKWRRVPWRRVWLLLPLLFGAGVPYLLLFAHGLARSNSGQAAVLGPGASSALVVVFAMLLLKERLRPAQLVGLALTLLGVGLLVAHDALSGGARLAGFGLILVGSAGWAAYTLASRVLALEPLLNAALVCCVNAALYLPIYFAAGGAAQLAALPAAPLVLQLLYQGVLTAVVALAAYAFAVQRLGAAAAAGFSPLAPVLATVFGWLLLGDPVSPATAAGLVAVTSGVLIAGRAAVATPRR